MDFLRYAIDLFLHLDVSLGGLIQHYGTLTYAFLFLVIFAETGLVVTPFLPGDSLLFAAGAFAALGSLNIVWLLVLLYVAAILGDSLNYFIGRKLGTKAFEMANGRILKKSYLEQTQKFYAKYGARMIVLARFVPIVRTFAPFVAGIGQMEYRTFLSYNILGGALWVSIFTLAGYLFGNIPSVKENFTLVILAVIAVSLMPPFVEFLRVRRKK